MEKDESSSTQPPPSASRSQSKPSAARQRGSSAFYITFVSASSDGTAKVWRILFDPFSSANMAADAAKRRSQHLSGTHAAQGPVSPENVAFGGDPGNSRPKNLGTADMAMARAESISSLTSWASTMSLAPPLRPGRPSASVSGYPQELDDPLNLSCFSGHAPQTGTPPPDEPNRIGCCAVVNMPEKRLVATGDSIGVVRLWQPETAKEVTVLVVAKTQGISDHNVQITACSFSLPESRPILATGNAQSIIRLWDYERKALLAVFDKHLLPILGIHFVNGREIISVSTARILRWNYKKAIEMRKERNDARTDNEGNKSAIAALMLPSEAHAQRTGRSSRPSSAAGRLQAEPHLGEKRCSSVKSRPKKFESSAAFPVEDEPVEIVLPHKSQVITSSDFLSSRGLLVIGTSTKGLAIYDAQSNGSECASLQSISAGSVGNVRFGIIWDDRGQELHLTTRSQKSVSQDVKLISINKCTAVLHDLKKLTSVTAFSPTLFQPLFAPVEGSQKSKSSSVVTLSSMGHAVVSLVEFSDSKRSASSEEGCKVLFDLSSDAHEKHAVTSMNAPNASLICLGTSRGDVLAAWRREDGDWGNFDAVLNHPEGPVTVLEVVTLEGGNAMIASAAANQGIQVWKKGSVQFKLQLGSCIIDSMKLCLSSADEVKSDRLLVVTVKPCQCPATASYDSGFSMSLSQSNPPQVEIFTYDVRSEKLITKFDAVPAYTAGLFSLIAGPGPWRCWDAPERVERSEKLIYDFNEQGNRIVIATSSTVAQIFDTQTGRVVGRIQVHADKSKVARAGYESTSSTSAPAFASFDGQMLTKAQQRIPPAGTEDPDDELAAIEQTMLNLSLNLDSELQQMSLDGRCTKQGNSNQHRALTPGRAPGGQNSNRPEAMQVPWITAIKLSPDGSLSAIGNSEGNLLIWSIPKSRWVGQFGANIHGSPINDILFSSCGRLLVVACGNKLAWWSLDLVIQHSPADFPDPDATPTIENPHFTWGKEISSHRSSRSSVEMHSHAQWRRVSRRACKLSSTSVATMVSIGEHALDGSLSGDLSRPGHPKTLRFGLSDDIHQLTGSTLQPSSTKPGPAGDERFTATSPQAMSISSLVSTLGSKQLSEMLRKPAAIPKLEDQSFDGSQSSSDGTANRTGGCNVCMSRMHEKKTLPGYPAGLLRVFEMNNGPLRRVVSNPQFDEFVTIDDAGSVFLLRVVAS